MSDHTASAAQASAPRHDRRGWRVLAGEPLLQFLVIGAGLFAADHWLHPPVADNHVIVVTQQMRRSIEDNYDEDHARKATDAEVKAVIDNWVNDEILYREGKALGLDLGDPTIRDRIIYKLKVMLSDEAKPLDPTPEELQAWFEEHRARYDEPDRVTFLATAPVAEDVARREYESIRKMRETADLQEQTRVFVDRPRTAVAPVFGEAFAVALEKAPIGQWQVMQSGAGWHVVRVDARKSGRRVALDDVRGDAVNSLKAERTLKNTLEAIRRLQARYTVRYEP
jgi:PPIC-type PPIASE domain